MSRSNLVFAIKLILGIGLVYLLLSQKDVWQGATTLLSGLSLPGVVVVMLIPIPLVWASCLKWRLLLRYRDCIVGLPSLMRYYTIGYFFNNFLPSSVGGDLARSYLVGRRIGSQAESFAAVFLERLTGLLTLVALAVIGFAATPSLHDDLLVAGSIAIMAGGCLFLLAMIWLPDRLTGPLKEKACKHRRTARLVERIEEMRTALASFWSAPGIVLQSFAYSMLYHLLTVANIFITARVLGIDLDLVSLWAVAPIILVIAALPTTPGGIGVWEWAFSVLLLPIGTELEHGLAVALLLRAQLLVTSLLGAVFYVFDGRGRLREV
ncbi:lysylphosphatidylglycerol synthase transmembrane domain-containing protein [Salipiger sp. 1_MG-2023]|uniref:lysylphosphatidylglycerol synthase transmembrane domain-containing protein n=1 Tax=Salipiger sp. 1_MG-2023 TaxID=3062665 RepID=UPI0026E291F1|nr:lysylphosphatidylglycerol synthase transmembrane domain-containing protein [Salipiger sp. 1_MG-2023]MDO6587049.1 lysylphosphatidylglycerol synthase transmembrane domain-containing protein [Salipiger sp. 1_MG-2023]